jgi:phage shock protein PspC (stress-responsive transcriptional regulator)
MTKRLYRSQSGAMLGGVCTGLSKYLNIDVIWIRLFFVLLGVTSGFGILAYLVLWVVVPREDQVTSKEGVTVIQPTDFSDKAHMMGNEIKDAASKNNTKLPLFIGIGLIVLGGFAFLNTLPFAWVHFIKNLVLWPAILILAGAVLIIRGFKGDK